MKAAVKKRTLRTHYLCYAHKYEMVMLKCTAFGWPDIKPTSVLPSNPDTKLTGVLPSNPGKLLPLTLLRYRMAIFFVVVVAGEKTRRGEGEGGRKKRRKEVGRMGKRRKGREEESV